MRLLRKQSSTKKWKVSGSRSLKFGLFYSDVQNNRYSRILLDTKRRNLHPWSDANPSHWNLQGRQWKICYIDCVSDKALWESISILLREYRSKSFLLVSNQDTPTGP